MTQTQTWENETILVSPNSFLKGIFRIFLLFFYYMLFGIRENKVI